MTGLLLAHWAVTIWLFFRWQHAQSRRREAEESARAAWAGALYERAAREAAEVALREEVVALRTHVVAQPFDSSPAEEEES
jgi:hypothetical protein